MHNFEILKINCRFRTEKDYHMLSTAGCGGGLTYNLIMNSSL